MAYDPVYGTSPDSPTTALGKVYRNWKTEHDAVYNARQNKSKQEQEAYALRKLEAQKARVLKGLPPNETYSEFFGNLGSGVREGSRAIIDGLDFSNAPIDVTPSYKNQVATAGLGTPGGYGGTGTRRMPQINPTVSVPAAAPVQNAQDFSSMPFKQAFAAARAAGLPEFTWRDKGRFNTRLDTEESPVQVATQAATAPVEQTPAEVQVPVQTTPTMQRQPVATGYGSGLPSGNALVQGDPRLREIYARIRAENAAKQATAMASGL